MTPTPLTVSIDNVVLTEEQAERVATALTAGRAARAEEERRNNDRALRVGGPSGGDYLNIPRAVFLEMMARFDQQGQPAYMVLRPNGAVGHNGPSVKSSPVLRTFGGRD